MTMTPVAADGPLFVAMTVNVTFEFSAGVALFTVLVTARSVSGVAVTETDEELLATFVSDSVPPMLAVFVTGDVVVTVAVIVSEAVAALARLPIVQRPVPLLYDPAEAVDDTKVKPAGSASVTTTPVAAAGPLFVAVIVNVTFEFTGGVALLTVFVTARSVTGVAVTDADAELLAALPSVSVPVIVAVFVTCEVVVAVAVIVSVALAPMARFPIVHTPVALSYEPADTVDDT